MTELTRRDGRVVGAAPCGSRELRSLTRGHCLPPRKPGSWSPVDQSGTPRGHAGVSPSGADAMSGRPPRRSTVGGAAPGVTTWLRKASVVALLIGLTAAGCQKDDESRYGVPPTDRPSAIGSSPTVAVPSPSPADAQQVLAQYKRFWTDALPRAFSVKAEQRRAILAPVVMDPELTTLLHNMTETDKAGEKGYGADIPLRQRLEIRAGISLVRGCLDSSRAGFADLLTGKEKTRGIAQNPVLVNLRRAGDGVWRVSDVSYPGGTKC